jgi:RNA polymerase sigma-70 factor (ECF subfamily)
MKDIPLNSTDLDWLRGLARALLGEAHAADDLVQETAVVALENSVPVDAPRRAWLSSVARRLAARRFRSDGRRTHREELVARPEALPDTAELVERAEVAEQVTTAARQLPEPFRRTVLLRFLEGLSPEEIARDEGKPADTVRWRLRRGLELMREDLVRRNDRDWSSWSVLLLPLARPRGEVGLATAGTSGALVGTVALWTTMKMITLVVAAASCAGIWLVWNTSNEELVETAVADRAPVVDEVLLQASAVEQLVVASIDRAPVPPTQATEDSSAVDDASALGILGKVVDELGDPVAGATVYLLPPTGEEREERADGRTFDRTQSDSQGAFRISPEELDSVPKSGISTVVVGVVANGFLRQFVREIEHHPRGEELLIVLERGRTLAGRVVDEYGLPVPDLELLAHTAHAGIAHVSPSQMLLRSERNRLGDEAAEYDECRARTDRDGDVIFSGLPKGVLKLRPLDPGWSIEDPGRVEAGEDYVVWSAMRRLGIRLLVVDAYTGLPVDKASATFNFELGFANGEVRDFGQWVGRGAGEVSFVIGSEVLPGLEERTITRAAFYGTVRSGSSDDLEWVAEAIEGAVGVAEVRVEIDTRGALGLQESGNFIELEQPEWSTLEMDVRYNDGDLFVGELSASWSSRPDFGAMRTGDARPKRLAPGRYSLEVVAGELTLEVADRNASGSLPAWTDTLRCDPDRMPLALVTLPRGATATIARPEGWSGEWFVHASWRLGEDDDWQGSWGYSTDEASLTLNAMRPAEWRFQLRRDSALAADPVVRTVLLTE